MWVTRTLRTLTNEDLGTLAENDPLTGAAGQGCRHLQCESGAGSDDANKCSTAIGWWMYQKSSSSSCS